MGRLIREAEKERACHKALLMVAHVKVGGAVTPRGRFAAMTSLSGAEAFEPGRRPPVAGEEGGGGGEVGEVSLPHLRRL